MFLLSAQFKVKKKVQTVGLFSRTGILTDQISQGSYCFRGAIFSKMACSGA